MIQLFFSLLFHESFLFKLIDLYVSKARSMCSAQYACEYFFNCEVKQSSQYILNDCFFFGFVWRTASLSICAKLQTLLCNLNEWTGEEDFCRHRLAVHKKHLFSMETNDFLLGSRFEKRKGLDLRIDDKTKQSRSHSDWKSHAQSTL